VIFADGLATGLQFCAIVHVADVISFFSVTGGDTLAAEVVTVNVHFTCSDSEKPTVVDTAVIVPGAAVVVLTPFKELGFAVDSHVTSEA